MRVDLCSKLYEGPQRYQDSGNAMRHTILVLSGLLLVCLTLVKTDTVSLDADTKRLAEVVITAIFLTGMWLLLFLSNKVYFFSVEAGRFSLRWWFVFVILLVVTAVVVLLWRRTWATQYSSASTARCAEMYVVNKGE